jgi:hypothetical protein
MAASRDVQALIKQLEKGDLCKVYRTYTANVLQTEFFAAPQLAVGAPCLKKTYFYAGSDLTGEVCELATWTAVHEDSVTDASFTNEFSCTFDGVDEYISLGDNYDFERTDAFSIHCYFKTGATVGTDVIMSRFGVSPKFPGWQVYITNGALGFNLLNDFGAGDQLALTTDTDTYDDDAWHHVVYTYDGSSLASGVNIYVDGTLQAVTASVDALVSSIFVDTDAEIATRDGGNLLWEGELDEIGVHNIELTAAQASTIYNGGVPLDLTALSVGDSLIGYWHFTQTDKDNFPTIADHSSSGINGTAVNMESADIQTDTP